MKKFLKGFTLMELIVVLAIIGVLAAVMAPSMINYYRSSRLKDANADAKMVYNAVQTEMQKMLSRDRTSGGTKTFSGAVIVYYNENGTITSTYDGGLDSAPGASTNADVVADCQTVANAVNRVVSDGEMLNWAVCIENYIVKGCYCAEAQNTNYVGKFSAVGSAGNVQAQDRETANFGTLMATGSKLASYTDNNYGLDTYTPAPAPAPGP